MNRDYLPLSMPDEISDEAIAQLVECLYELTRCLENHYFARLRRYYEPHDERQQELWPALSPDTLPEQDPPF